MLHVNESKAKLSICIGVKFWYSPAIYRINECGYFGAKKKG
ncbi:hypothetical protein STSP2_00714 [Anaerohalosphaera lusitana]|uniref:Uncharacterized protein n=1 Tax=Anaerohalosphaera lusitana TaxID=1936003 RepID=A0A1U9NJ73_9BACT|nr:hypothetical protein STSP2_00714 [Anaerohalosphaera lusitana]